MNRFVVLLWDKNDVHNRHWVLRDNIEEARKVASEYESTGWIAEVIPYTIDLRQKV